MACPTNFCRLTVGILPVNLNDQHSEGDPDPENDLSPPTAAEKWRWGLVEKLEYYVPETISPK
jgi:hypothetical protein